MNLTGLLRMGGGALLTHQARMELTQGNIANASTPGYRRQRADLVTLGGAYGSASLRGVTLGGIQSVEAPLIDRQLAYQRGDYGFYSARSEVGAILEATGNPFNGDSLSEAIGDFFGAARTLSAEPNSGIQRQALLDGARHLADHFHRIHSTLAEARQETWERIGEEVSSLNEQLERIAQLDRQVQTARAAGHHPGELVDARDEFVQRLAGEIGLRVVPNDDGTINLVTAEGRALVEGGRARTITAERGPNGILLSARDGREAPQSISRVGGRLGGLVSGHDDVLGEQIRGLDQLAFELAGAINTVHAAGYGADGGTGRPFFTPLAAPDGAARLLAVDPALAANPNLLATAGDPGEVPGGNGALQALLGLESAALPAGLSPDAAARALSSALSRTLGSDRRNASHHADGVAQLQALQQSVSGVSIEEEMVTMMETQRAFEAASKLIVTADEMLQVVLSLKQ